MLVLTVICENDHQFEGWFRSGADFDRQVKKRQVACATCGSTRVSRGLTTPNVALKGAVTTSAGERRGDLAAHREKVGKMMRAMRDHVEKNFDYVGDAFASEARRIHEGLADDRGIYGEAKPAEVKELLEDGVPVAPLPDVPEKAN